MAVAEGVGGADTPAAPAAAGTKPPGGVKFFYSVGQVVESTYLVTNTFIFFYYTAVLGLPGGMVGLAVAVSMALDAICDPLIGSWSDSLRTRLGRRLPLMLLGAPLTMLTMGLLFSPPGGLTPFLLFGYLTLVKMSVRAFASVFNIPYYALGGEMTDDYVERTRLVAYRLLAGIVVTVAITALASMVFFKGEGGLQIPERYPAFGWTMGIGLLVIALIACAGVWRYAVGLPQPKEAAPGMLRRLPGELAEIFRNRSFLILFFSLLVFSSSAGVHQALNNHAYVFVWKLRPELILPLRPSRRDAPDPVHAALAGEEDGLDPRLPHRRRRLARRPRPAGARALRAHRHGRRPLAGPDHLLRGPGLGDHLRGHPLDDGRRRRRA